MHDTHVVTQYLLVYMFIFLIADGMDDTDKKPSLFLTYDGLQKKAEELKCEEAVVQTQLVNLENSHNENLTTM